MAHSTIFVLDMSDIQVHFCTFGYSCTHINLLFVPQVAERHKGPKPHLETLADLFLHAQALATTTY